MTSRAAALHYSKVLSTAGTSSSSHSSASEIRRSMTLSTASTTNEEQESHSKCSKLYRTMAFLYFVVASFMIAMHSILPSRDQQFFTNNKSFRTIHNISGAIGFFMASFISLFLHKHHASGNTLLVVDDKHDASVNNKNITDSGKILETKRSSCSSTTSRLNIGLGMFSSIGLLSIPGESVLLMPSFPNAAIGLYSFMSLSRLLGAWHCWKKWFHYDKKGTIAFCSSRLDVTNDEDQDHGGKRKISGLYNMIQLFALSRIVHNVMSVLHATKYQQSSASTLWFMKSIYISAVARLCLVWSTASALKEASSSVQTNFLGQRSRLHLQILLGIWAVSVGIISGFIDANLISFILQKSVYLMVFAWPIMFKGEKDKKGSRR